MLDAQTIAIIGVGVSVLAVFVPLLITLIVRMDKLNERMDNLTQVVTALANHRHAEDGAPSFALPAD